MALLLAIAAFAVVALYSLPDPARAEANNPPFIGGGASVTITVAENTTGSIGRAFTATDKDADDTISWSVSGASAFDISGGQLSLASGATLDYETRSAYSLTVTASDGNGGTHSVAVKVAVTDVKESPPANADGAARQHANADGAARQTRCATGDRQLQRQPDGHVERARQHWPAHHPVLHPLLS